MFFPDRILSIKPTDKVLEVGPGATPYFRSDVFLELEYEKKSERIAQSGHVGILETDKPVVYYNGGKFPFSDSEFDYIICSHVLEHVADVEFFLGEVQRVSKKGYLEFPTIYYDYVYNFPEHLNFLLYRNGVINWMKKDQSGLDKYSSIQKFFYRTCELGYQSPIFNFKNYYFQGFEWSDEIKFRSVSDIESLTFRTEEIKLSSVVEQSEKNNTEKVVIYESVSLKGHLKYKIKKLFGAE